MSKEIKIVPAGVNSIGALKTFSYPTRLAATWEPKILGINNILEINIPPYEIYRPAIKITIEKGIINSLKTANIVRKIYRKISSPIDLDDKYILDTRYETDKNIAHILRNIAPGLLAAKKNPREIDDITVILKANACEMAKTAYQLLGFSVLCTDKYVKGKIITAPTGKSGEYELWYKELFGTLSFEGYKTDTPKRVFIPRKGKRSLINEAEVENLLQEYGFQKFYYEDIPISEQWSISKNAEIIVALHGAALSSIVFNHNPLKVIELFHPGYVTRAYRHMTYAIGGSWCGVAGQITENVIKELDFKNRSRAFATSPTKIDLKSLEMALDHMKIDKV